MRRYSVHRFGRIALVLYHVYDLAEPIIGQASLLIDFLQPATQLN